MINNVVLVGRLTRDPELRYTPSNVAVATFSLAVNRNFKNQAGDREADLLVALCGANRLRILQIGQKRALWLL